MSKVDAQKIIDNVILSEYVGRKVDLRKDGDEHKGLCPFHNEKTPSFTVNDDKNFYHCFGCGEHGDIFDWLDKQEGMGFKEAAAFLTGNNDQPKQNAKKKKTTRKKEAPLTPAPDGVSPPTEVARKINNEWVKFPVVSSWAYKNIDGQVIGYDTRIETPDGKEIVPFRWIDSKWKQGGLPKPRTLYNVNTLSDKPEALVIVGEGCKTADAIENLFPKNVAISWQGGSKAVKHSDWRSLDGRKVMIWPDADETGWAAAVDIANQLVGIAAEIRLIDVRNDDLPKGWDAADFEGTNKEAMQFIKERMVEYQIPEEPKADSEPLPDVIDGEQVFDDPEEAPLDTAPFRILGYNQGTYYFLPSGGGQVVALSASSMSAANLLTLGSLNYWEAYTGGLGKGELLAAQNMLIRSSESAGVFVPERIRGRGAWMDEGRTVVNVGTHLIVDGVATRQNDFDTRNIYEVGPFLDIDLANVATTNTAKKLMDLCEMLSWRYSLSGKLLAGWLMSSLVCGIFRWRQHLWITGPSGSGKSTVMEDIIRRFLRDVSLNVEGGTTEASIRQTLKFDVLPVLVDEFEAENKRQDAVAQEVLNLARKASSGATIRKGTASGKSMFFLVRQAFCFSSINQSIRQRADESRITTLHLKPNTETDAEEKFSEIKKMIADTLTPEFTASMFARAVKYLPVLVQNEDVFSQAATAVFSERRAADGLGPILAGAYLCHSHKVVDFDTAKKFIERYEWGEHTAINSAKDKDRILTHIVSRRIRIHGEDVSIGELIYAASDQWSNDDTAVVGYNAADKALRRIGIRVWAHNHDKHNERSRVAIAETISSPASELFEGTPWATNWKEPMREIEGALSGQGPVYFFAGLTQRATILPLDLFVEKNA